MNRKALIVFHGLVGIGALGGGMGVVIDPSGALMGVPLSLLETSPFKDYLIPGLFLVVVLGIGNIAALGMTYKKIKGYPYINIALGGILVLWIMIQCYLIQTIAPLHVIFFAIGCIQGVLGLYEGYQKRIYPLNLIFLKH